MAAFAFGGAANQATHTSSIRFRRIPVDQEDFTDTRR